jgi:hypothetical protein
MKTFIGSLSLCSSLACFAIAYYTYGSAGGAPGDGGPDLLSFIIVCVALGVGIILLLVSYFLLRT